MSEDTTVQTVEQVADHLAEEQRRAQRTADIRAQARALAGGRLTQDVTGMRLGGKLLTFSPPRDPEGRWQMLDLDDRPLSRVRPSELFEWLADLSPDVGRALWDYLRLLNPGYEVLVYQPGTDEPHPQGQAATDGFLALLTRLYGGFDVVVNRLYIGQYLRGALFAELVLDPAGSAPVDLVVPDPATARFKLVDDPVRGQVWQLGQLQAGSFVPLERDTVQYVPVDPFPGSPYGRPVAAPALSTALFLLGLLRDLKRVVQQQGYPRLDVEVVLEQLATVMPDYVADSDQDKKAWVDAIVAEVQASYATLQPEDAYVHSSVIKINRPVGTVDSSSLGAIDGLFRALERLLVRALKTVPFMMAVAESTTETQANRQWEALLQSIKALQHLAENLLGSLLGLGLQAQGIAADVRVRFAENRASEVMRDEQARALRNANSFFEYAVGWRSQDEAAMETVGHPPDVPAPRLTPKSFGTGEAATAGTDTATNPEPGTERQGGDVQLRDPFTPAGAGEPLPPLPPVVGVTSGVLDRASAMWDAAQPDPYDGLLEAVQLPAGANGRAHP